MNFLEVDERAASDAPIGKRLRLVWDLGLTFCLHLFAHTEGKQGILFAFVAEFEAEEDSLLLSPQDLAGLKYNFVLMTIA